MFEPIIVNVFTTYRIQTVQQYAVIRSVNYGWVCNFVVHSDDVLFNTFDVDGTESPSGHRVSYIFSDYLLKILITRICQYINFTLCIPCGLCGNLPCYKVPAGFYNNIVCCLRQKRLCWPHR